jgi:chromosome segregation ATPase
MPCFLTPDEIQEQISNCEDQLEEIDSEMVESEAELNMARIAVQQQQKRFEACQKRRKRRLAKIEKLKSELQENQVDSDNG